MTYYNGTKFTWTMGRRLESATRSNGSKVTYTYNADGLLTSKKVGNYKLDYFWDGDKLTAQTDGVNTWYFRYDGDTPIGLEFDGIEYYYVTNLQGDVIAILDSNGAVAAEYSYDAWGNCTVIKDTNTIALDNPLRYRGYYYDAHIGLYYLQSRYYDANTGRFINADAPEMISQGVYNLFSYCDNNPVNKIDPTGHYAGVLVLSGSLTASLSGALTGIMTGISAAIAGIKTAIAMSWFVPVCIAATAIAIVGIVYVVKKVTSLMKFATKAISAVKAKVKSGGLNPKKLNGYSVYVITRHKTQDVVYVGITKNYNSRKKQHTGKGKRFYGYDMKPIATGLTKAQARAMEQTIISAYTLDTLKNLINSISPKKWSKFKTEFKQMQTLMQSWIDPE